MNSLAKGGNILLDLLFVVVADLLILAKRLFGFINQLFRLIANAGSLAARLILRFILTGFLRSYWWSRKW